MHLKQLKEIEILIDDLENERAKTERQIANIRENGTTQELFSIPALRGSADTLDDQIRKLLVIHGKKKRELQNPPALPANTIHVSDKALAHIAQVANLHAITQHEALDLLLGFDSPRDDDLDPEPEPEEEGEEEPRWAYDPDYAGELEERAYWDSIGGVGKAFGEENAANE